MDAYKYEPLVPTGTEIRLIRIEPSQQFSAQVRCSIFKVRLEDSPTYNALSYCWGDQSNPICIKVNGCLFPVGINLYLALQRLRSLAKDVPAVYWVDAICIDQKNDEERGHQVSVMRNIFEGANEVSVWLGAAAKGSALAMALIRLWSTVDLETQAEDMKDCFSKQPALFDKRYWKALKELFNRAWWDRVWVYQEIVVSRKAMFVCGGDTLDCDQLWVTIDNLIYLSSPRNLQLFGNIDRSSIRWFVGTGFMLLHRESRRTRCEFLKDHCLLTLLLRTRYKLATDPRDKIYALLGVDEVGDIAVMPDYTISTSTVYQKFTVNCIKARDDLSIICFGGIEIAGLKELSNSPSWVPDFSEASRSAKIDIGSFVGKDSFITSKAYRPLYSFSLGNQVLKARGLVSDTVTDFRPSEDSVSQASWGSTIMCWSELALSLVATPHPTGISQYQAFFRTIIRDKSGYGDDRPLNHHHLRLDVSREFVTLLMGFFLVMRQGKDVDARERDPAIQHKMELWNKIHEQNSLWARGFALWRGALDEPVISNIPTSDELLVAPFLSVSGSIRPLELHEMLDAVKEDAYAYALEYFFATSNSLRQNRCFFVSSKGYMGLGPLGTHIGDEICVLLGCNQPLLIRRVGDHHLVVGQCYVYGMMYGEMIDEMEAGRLVAEDFHFK